MCTLENNLEHDGLKTYEKYELRMMEDIGKNKYFAFCCLFKQHDSQLLKPVLHDNVTHHFEWRNKIRGHKIKC